MTWTLATSKRPKLANDRRPYLTTLLVRLYQNDVGIPSPGMSTGSFVPCDFPGYADKLATWGIGYLNAVGNGETDADPLTWTMTGSSPSNTVYGVVLIDPADNTWVAAQNDPNGPALLNGPAQRYVANLVWQVGQGPC